MDKYNHCVPGYHLQKIFEREEAKEDGTWYAYIEYEPDLSDTLESLGMPVEHRKDVTAVYALIWEGDYIAVWASESSAPHWLYSHWYALPFYKSDNWGNWGENLPIYWHESNEYYNEV